MMKVLAVIFLCFLLGACHQERAFSRNGQAISERALAEQKEFSRQLLLGLRCRKCHDARLDTALSGALEIFDLSQQDWDGSMNLEEYQGALKRVQAEESPTKEQQEKFEKYVRDKIQGLSRAEPSPN